MRLLILALLIVGIGSSLIVPGTLPDIANGTLPRLQGDSYLAFFEQLQAASDNATEVDALLATVDSCDPIVQMFSLIFFYTFAGGENWTTNAGWPDKNGMGGNATCLVEPLSSTSEKLPSWCCWFGVTCCVVSNSTLDSMLTPERCGVDEMARLRCNCSNFGRVTAIQLSDNNLAGMLPIGFLRFQSCELKTIDLAFNQLEGTLTDEDVVFLKQLRMLLLARNKLSGTIPTALNDLPELRVLDLTSNNLTGTVPANLCNGFNESSSFTDILLAGNQLEGELGLIFCEKLILLDASNNSFVGALPSFVGFPELHIARLADNNFSGTIPDLTSTPLLSDLDLSSNLLEGRVPDSIGGLRLLASVDMSDNGLTGSLNDSLFTKLGNFQYLDMSNNQLTGVIPHSIANAMTLRGIDLINNSLVGTIPESMSRLTKTSTYVYLSDNLLSCCGLGAVTDSSADGLYFVADAYNGVNWTLALTQPLPAFLNFSDVLIPVPPSSRNRSYTAMRCPLLVSFDHREPLLNWYLDPEYYLFQRCTCDQGYKLTNLTQPGRLPYYECTLDSASQSFWAQFTWLIAVIIVSVMIILIVVLIITCWQRGTKPAVLQQLLNFRKRVQGEPKTGQVTVVTTDIEGYSDMMKREPELMGKGLRMHNFAIDKARWQNFGYTFEQEGDSFTLVFYDAFDGVAFALQAQLLLQRQDWPERLSNPDGNELRPSKGSSVLRQALDGAARMFGRDQPLNGSIGLVELGSGGADERTPIGLVAGSKLFKFASMKANRQDQERLGTANTMSPSTSDGLRTTLTQSSSNPLLFNGLRVRMGIATGVLPVGVTLQNSHILEQAKLVSDAAGGGQILMDQATFTIVKNRAVELGAVDHNGISLGKINISRPSLWRRMRGRLDTDVESAVVLDMGQFVYAPHHTRQPTAFQPIQKMAASFRSQSFHADTAHGPLDDATANALDPLVPRLHLYQIVSPQLVQRARYFESKLALKEGWMCVDAPYFDAPGTLSACLGLENNSTIPAITMVFSTVEGVKDWKPSISKDKRILHHIIAETIIATLLHVSGYLCRLQDGEFKYMLAFDTPEEACKWCLLIQDALLWQDWPDSILRQQAFKEERNDKGEIIFRGPRLRMGMCHGCPRAIVPDHMGRADYHGHSINSAARYMDAAANGGQIVLEEALALQVLATWNQAAEVAQAIQSTHISHQETPTCSSGVVLACDATPPETGTHTTDAVPGSCDNHGQPGQGNPVSLLTSHLYGNSNSNSKRRTSGSVLSSVLEREEGDANPEDMEEAEASGRVSQQGDGHTRTNSCEVSWYTNPALGVSCRPSEMDESRHSLESGHPAGHSFNGVTHPDAPAGHRLAPTETGGSQPVTEGLEGTGCQVEVVNAPFLVDQPAASQISAQPFPLGDASVPESPSPSHPTITTQPSPISHAASLPHKLERPDVDQQPAGSQRGVRFHAAPGPSSTGSLQPSHPPPALELTLQPRSPESISRSPVSRPSAPRHPTGILKVPPSSASLAGLDGVYIASGGSGASGLRTRPCVRIQFPIEALERSSLQPGIDTPDIMTSSTYNTVVLVYKLGSYQFKGSPDEVPMAHVILEALALRKFPPEPPKGKGGRVLEASGLLSSAPYVQLPSVSRQYCWVWHTSRETALPPTPRNNTFKGMVSRVNSIIYPQMELSGLDTHHVTPGGQPPTSAFPSPNPSRGQVVLSNVISHSKNLLSLMRNYSRKSPHVGLDGTNGNPNALGGAGVYESGVLHSTNSILQISEPGRQARPDSSSSLHLAGDVA